MQERSRPPSSSAAGHRGAPSQAPGEGEEAGAVGNGRSAAAVESTAAPPAAMEELRGGELEEEEISLREPRP
jgi:hypothetical protein